MLLYVNNLAVKFLWMGFLITSNQDQKLKQLLKSRFTRRASSEAIRNFF